MCPCSRTQAKFKMVYGAPTFSNNNNWLRRKLMEGQPRFLSC